MKLKKRRRLGVSEIVGSIILIAVTFVLAMATWAWVNSSTVQSEANLGSSMINDINTVNERFQIVATNFNYSSSSATTTSTMYIWITNGGVSNATICYILLNNTAFKNISPGVTGCSNPNFSGATSFASLPIKSGSLGRVQLSLPTSVARGDSQVIKAIGKYGSYSAYSVVS